MQKKARARARAASLGNAFSEIESLLGEFQSKGELYSKLLIIPELIYFTARIR